jgi:hypothetical protein
METQYVSYEVKTENVNIIYITKERTYVPFKHNFILTKQLHFRRAP